MCQLFLCQTDEEEHQDISVPAEVISLVTCKEFCKVSMPTWCPFTFHFGFVSIQFLVLLATAILHVLGTWFPKSPNQSMAGSLLSAG